MAPAINPPANPGKNPPRASADLGAAADMPSTMITVAVTIADFLIALSLPRIEHLTRLERRNLHYVSAHSAIANRNFCIWQSRLIGARNSKGGIRRIATRKFPKNILSVFISNIAPEKTVHFNSFVGQVEYAEEKPWSPKEQSFHLI